MLDCSQKTVRRLVDEKKLTGLKVKNCLRISADSLEKYVKQQILEFQTRDGLDENSGPVLD